MKSEMDFRGRRVLIVGLARSGAGAANLLDVLGADVTVNDKKNAAELAHFTGVLRPAIKAVLGCHPIELFSGSDLIVVSPGVPLSIKPLQEAASAGVRIMGELELAYQFSTSLSAEGQSPQFLSVTGTNGKSTTTSLLFEMMKAAGFKTIVGGNIGKALTEEILNLETKIQSLDFIVAEVSSFQLETIDTFRPKVASILNITADHMDRYESLDAYIDAKCRIFMNQQSSDFLVLNADDPMTFEIAKRIKPLAIKGAGLPQIFYFSRKTEVHGAYYSEGSIRFNAPELGLSPDFSLHPSHFKIKGIHNIENSMAAALMALSAGCPAEAVEDSLRKFQGLEHRLEFVREIDGISFINDSKGTNVGAVEKSLESFDSPIILIAGGRDKDGDFIALRSLVKNRVKSLVLIGESADKIMKAIGDVTDAVIEKDMASAVTAAKNKASVGDVVLLSPACASFDMFKDFEDRGRKFKEAVMAL
jgi:UDP-N-acetylmuramoylalanine--D-glutamate ligase